MSSHNEKYNETLEKKLNRMVLIDIEASGFGVSSYPIEIAFADFSGTISDSFLINPETDTHYDINS